MGEPGPKGRSPYLGSARNFSTRILTGTSPLAWGLAALLVLAHGSLVVLEARALGCTTDESSYINAGRIILRHGWVDERTRYQGPLALVANQLFVGSFPSGGYQRRAGQEGLLFRARLATLPFALLGACLVFLWARAAFGDPGGLLALALYALDPLLIGYGGTLLVDVQLAALLLLAYFLLWRFVQTGRRGFLPALGAALGLALGTKYSACLVAGPIAATAALAALVHERRRAGHPRRSRGLLSALGAVLGIGACSLLALQACYGFRGGFASLAPAHYSTGIVRGLVGIPLAGKLAALLPAPFLEGVDFQLAMSARSWLVFLNGTFARGHPGYYLWTFLCKTPEVVLACAAAVLFLRLTDLARPGRRGFTTALVLVPSMVLVLGYLSLGTEMQLGVRYALFLYPMLFVLLGSLPGRSVAGAAPLLAVLAGAHAWDLHRSWPDLVGYYNAASGGQALAFRRFRDTNGDYGQHEGGLEELRRRSSEPFETLGAGSGACFGRLAAGNRALRTTDPDDASRSRFEWLTGGELLGHLGASWWIFAVTPEGLEERVNRTLDPDLRQDLVLAFLGADLREDAERHLRALDEARAAPLRALAALEDGARESATPQGLQALMRAWRELGRLDRVAQILARNPDLRATSEGIAAELADLEGREDFTGVVALLERIQLDPAHPMILPVVRSLKRLGRPEELFPLFERILARADGTPRAESPFLQEIREYLETARRLLALLE